jgi:hypothetical protein
MAERRVVARQEQDDRRARQTTVIVADIVEQEKRIEVFCSISGEIQELFLAK